MRKALIDLTPQVEKWLKNQCDTHHRLYGRRLADAQAIRAVLAAVAAAGVEIGNAPSEVHATVVLLDLLDRRQEFLVGKEEN